MPAYNEEAAIEHVVLQALAVLNNMNLQGEVMVLEDRSTDHTFAILQRLSHDHPQVRVLQNDVNRGAAGFERRLLLEARGEWMFFGSSDGETDYTRDVPRFYEIAQRQNLRGVYGYRVVKNYNRYRGFVSWTYKFLIGALFGVKFKDAGWVKLFHCPTYAPIPLYSDSAFISAERLLVANRRHVRYAELETAHLPRMGGRSRGGQWRWVVASFRDLLFTRLRWFCFNHFYKAEGPGDLQSK